MVIQKTLDNSKHHKNERFKLSKRKNTCLACGITLKNNHWSFCSFECKNIFSNDKIRFINSEDIIDSMRLGNAFGSEFDNLDAPEVGDKLRITKTEFGVTEKGKYAYVIITDANRGQLFTTKSAIVKTLQREEVQKVLDSGETIETEVVIRTSNKGREGVVLKL